MPPPARAVTRARLVIANTACCTVNQARHTHSCHVDSKSAHTVHVQASQAAASLSASTEPSLLPSTLAKAPATLRARPSEWGRVAGWRLGYYILSLRLSEPLRSTTTLAVSSFGLKSLQHRRPCPHATPTRRAEPSRFARRVCPRRGERVEQQRVALLHHHPLHVHPDTQRW